MLLALNPCKLFNPPVVEFTPASFATFANVSVPPTAPRLGAAPTLDNVVFPANVLVVGAAAGVPAVTNPEPKPAPP